MATNTNADKVNLNFFCFDATFSKKRTHVKIDNKPMAGITKQKDGVGGRNKPTTNRTKPKRYSE